MTTPDWPLRPISSLGSFINGYPFKPDQHGNEGLPIVRIRQLNDPAADVDYYDGFVPSRNRIDTGDLIFSWSGSLCVAIWDRGPAYLNQHLYKVLAGEQVDQGWLRWALSYSLELFDPYMHGSAMTHITQPMMRQVRVPVAPLNDQRRIARFLDEQVGRVDGLVAQRMAQIALMNESVKSRENALVWRGLGDSALAPAGLPQIAGVPEHWRRLRNKNLLKESRSLSLDGSEELLSVSHITGVTRRADKNVNMFLAESNEGYVKVSPGDLVINTMWAWMGALGVSPLEGIVSPAYGVYRPRSVEDFVPDYFDALYRSPAYVSEMTRFSTGVWSSRLRIYPEVFLSLPVVAPPAEEQKFIGARIRETREAVAPAIALLESSISLLNERKRALIAAAITGQLDLATASERAGKVAIA